MAIFSVFLFFSILICNGLSVVIWSDNMDTTNNWSIFGSIDTISNDFGCDIFGSVEFLISCFCHLGPCIELIGNAQITQINAVDTSLYDNIVIRYSLNKCGSDYGLNEYCGIHISTNNGVSWDLLNQWGNDINQFPGYTYSTIGTADSVRLSFRSEASLFLEKCCIDSVSIEGNIKRPSISPTKNPTNLPSVMPTLQPTTTPTITPTNIPTEIPSIDPSVNPTNIPTLIPSLIPSNSPSNSPTNTTNTPTNIPSYNPINSPSNTPSNSPSKTPTETPTETPTLYPSELPTNYPTEIPTLNPVIPPSNTSEITAVTPDILRNNNAKDSLKLTAIFLIGAVIAVICCVCSMWAIFMVRCIQKKIRKKNVSNIKNSMDSNTIENQSKSIDKSMGIIDPTPPLKINLNSNSNININSIKLPSVIPAVTDPGEPEFIRDNEGSIHDIYVYGDTVTNDKDLELMAKDANDLPDGNDPPLNGESHL